MHENNVSKRKMVLKVEEELCMNSIQKGIFQNLKYEKEREEFKHYISKSQLLKAQSN